jgi:hypothetical protein
VVHVGLEQVAEQVARVVDERDDAVVVAEAVALGANRRRCHVHTSLFAKPFIGTAVYPEVSGFSGHLSRSRRPAVHSRPHSHDSY